MPGSELKKKASSQLRGEYGKPLSPSLPFHWDASWRGETLPTPAYAIVNISTINYQTTSEIPPYYPAFHHRPPLLLNITPNGTVE